MHKDKPAQRVIPSVVLTTIFNNSNHDCIIKNGTEIIRKIEKSSTSTINQIIPVKPSTNTNSFFSSLSTHEKPKAGIYIENGNDLNNFLAINVQLYQSETTICFLKIIGSTTNRLKMPYNLQCTYSRSFVLEKPISFNISLSISGDQMQDTVMETEVSTTPASLLEYALLKSAHHIISGNRKQNVELPQELQIKLDRTIKQLKNENPVTDH